MASAFLASSAGQAFAHGVAKSDQAFVQSSSGVSFIPFMYLGAKHMVTGYDHLLFLLGVIFLLSGFREVYTYVTLFAVGHSISLIVAVLTGTSVNAFITPSSPFSPSACSTVSAWQRDSRISRPPEKACY